MLSSGGSHTASVQVEQLSVSLHGITPLLSVYPLRIPSRAVRSPSELMLFSSVWTRNIPIAFVASKLLFIISAILKLLPSHCSPSCFSGEQMACSLLRYYLFYGARIKLGVWGVLDKCFTAGPHPQALFFFFKLCLETGLLTSNSLCN